MDYIVAMNRVRRGIKEDPELYKAFHEVLAGTFKDAYDKVEPGRSTVINKVADKAATSFLDLLIN